MSQAEACPRIEALSAFADDQLVGLERQALAAHLAECAICRPVLVEFRRLRSDFARLPELAPGVDIAALVDRRLALAAGGPKSPPARDWRWWQLAPAALGSAASLWLGVYLGGALMLGPQTALQPAARQLAVFAAVPPGALCPAPQACNSRRR